MRHGDRDHHTPVNTIARHPRVALLIVTLLLAAFFVTLKIQQLRNFDVRDFDTGIYSNIAWNVATGDGLWSDVLGRHALSEHFSPIVAAFAPLYWVWPSALVLLIAQAVAVTLTFPLLAMIGNQLFRHHPPTMRVSLVAALLVMAFLYRPVFVALMSDFHPCTLGMPLVAAGLLILHLDRPRWLIPIVLALLCTKEMAALSVIGLGLYAWLVLNKPRLGVTLVITGIAAGLIILLVVMPHFRVTEWKHDDRLGPFIDLEDKAMYLLKLAAGLGFLPLFGWRALIAAAPLTLLNLLVKMPNQYSLDFHYDDQNSVFWLVAAAHGMNSLAAHLRRLDESRQRLVTISVVFAIATLTLVSSGLKPWKEFRKQFLKVPAEVAELRAALEMYIELPPEAGIAATGQIGPHVNLRNRYRRVNNLNIAMLANDLQSDDVVLVSPIRLPDGLSLPKIKAMLDGSPAFQREPGGEALIVYRRVGDSP